MARRWLEEHRASKVTRTDSYPTFSSGLDSAHPETRKLLSDQGFNNHDLNDGTHVSPYDSGRVDVGVDNLEVRLVQGVDEASFARVLSRALKATTGIAADDYIWTETADRDEMMKGGLQSALESQVIVFEVTGASRALTHQLVRSRRAAFHQQSQRATWYGDRPNARWPFSVLGHDDVAIKWEQAQRAAWLAYQAACDAGISYQDARYILPEATTNYILCEYSIREFIATFAYRGCSMFLWEMVYCMREMRRVLLAAHPFLEPHVKISCEKGSDCEVCGGKGVLKAVGGYTLKDGSEVDSMRCTACNGIGSSRKCTFQGWENVEGVCSLPWAKQSNRVFLPTPKYRIGE